MSNNTNRWITVAKTSDVTSDYPTPIEIGELQIALYKGDDDKFYATDNICTHAFALLSDGFQEGCTIECPLHAGCFDIRTGKALTAPLTEDLKTYPVMVEGDDILILLEA